MTTIQDCLSTFTVITGLRDPDGLSHWNKTIDSYLASIGDARTARAEALAELERRCRELKVDCEASAALLADIRRRMELTARAPAREVRNPRPATHLHGPGHSRDHHGQR